MAAAIPAASFVALFLGLSRCWNPSNLSFEPEGFILFPPSILDHIKDDSWLLKRKGRRKRRLQTKPPSSQEVRKPMI